MTRAQKILIVDDDPHIRQVVGFALKQAGFATIEAKDGRQCLEMFARQAPDLIVLDIMMPEMDGTDVCRRVRAESGVPIIFLSSRDDEVDRIVGLELGSDDYVTKPFSPRELVARVKAVLRRGGMAGPEGKTEGAANEAALNFLEHGRLRLDMDRFLAFWDREPIELTATEFGILQTLMGYPGKVYSRNELMECAYDSDNVVTDRTIDSHIRRVRQKFKDIGAEPIETVHGIGYRVGSCG